MLTAVGYFPAVMDWKARRKLLLDMCGDVRDEDVIATCNKYEMAMAFTGIRLFHH